MKNLIKRLVILLAMVLFAVPVFSQTEVPETIWDALDLRLWLQTFALLISLATFITTFVNGAFKIEKSATRKVMGWVISFILAALGKLLALGFLAEVSWLMILITGVLAGLGANGMFTVPLLQNLWYMLESLLNSPKAIEKLTAKKK